MCFCGHDLFFSTNLAHNERSRRDINTLFLPSSPLHCFYSLVHSTPLVSPLQTKKCIYFGFVCLMFDLFWGTSVKDIYFVSAAPLLTLPQEMGGGRERHLLLYLSSTVIMSQKSNIVNSKICGILFI